MSKITTLMKSSGTTSDDFRTYWTQSFLPDLLNAAETQDNLVRIVQNFVRPGDIGHGEAAPEPQWACATEFWYYDRPSAERFIASPAVAETMAAHADALPEAVHLHGYEVNGWDLEVADVALKAMNFFVPAKGMSREKAQQHWANEHQIVTTRLGMSRKLCKYAQNFVFPEHENTDPRYDFAGGPTMWFERMAEVESIFADETLLAELKADEAKFVDNSVTLLVEEETVFRAR